MKRKIKKWFHNLTAGKIVCFLLAAIWFLVTFYPLYFTLISSLKENHEIWGTMLQPPKVLQWQNYIEAAKSAHIFSAIANSLIVSLGSVAILSVLSLMSGYVLARRILKSTNFWSGYLMAALMIPLQGAVVPLVQMVGMIDGKNNFLVMTLIYVGLNMSMTMFIMTGYISSISKELDEAAAIDGCNLFQIVFRIIFPIAKPAVATAAIVGFLNAYNELPIANVILTKAENRTVSVALLAFKGDYQVELGLIFASIIIVIIPILVFYLLCQEKVENGLAAGAIKG